MPVRIRHAPRERCAARRPHAAVVPELVNRSVQFRACNNTLETHQIDRKRVIPEATIVPSRAAEVSRLRAREGHVCIKP